VHRHFPPSSRVRELEYAIREIAALARELERKGRRVVYLNIGDPLRYGFSPPPILRRALAEAIEEGYNFYAPSEGLEEFRQAIAERERRTNGVEMEAEDVIVTQGVSEAISFIMAAMLEEGDEVLLPSPCYPVYVNYVRLHGGIPRFYMIVEEGGEWKIRLENSPISPRTKIVVIINPHNPTGALLSREELASLIDAAREVGACIVSDEIYDRIVFEGDFYSTATLSDDVPVIGLNGFSKSYMVTGWRIGYMYFSDPEGRLTEVKEAIVKLARNRLSASTPAQKALAEVIRSGESFIEDLKREFKRRRDLLLDLMGEVEGAVLTAPRATFYAYPRLTVKGDWGDDLGFAKKLLMEEGVAVVHGTGFYDYRRDRFRLVFLPPPDVLGEAVEKIRAFIKRHASQAQ